MWKLFWSMQHIHILIFIQGRLYFHHFKLLVLLWDRKAVPIEFPLRINLSIIFLIWSKITFKQEHNIHPKSLLLFRLSVENHHMARATSACMCTFVFRETQFLPVKKLNSIHIRSQCQELVLNLISKSHRVIRHLRIFNIYRIIFMHHNSL